jgi:hypothetical protein
MITVSNAILLQQLFAQAATHPFNSYSRQVLASIHRCHTAANGMHTYRCNDTACHHLHYQYHAAATAIALAAAD